MESAMMYPLASKGGMYAMYRMAPRTKDYTLWEAIRTVIISML